jgi:hypothetical protein
VPPNQPTARLGSDVYVLVAPGAPGSAVRKTTLLHYRTANDTWTVHDVPSSATGGRLLATDTALVIYPESDERGETPDLWFDPVDGSWSELPLDPLSPSFDRTYAWDGEDLYLFAKQITPSPGGANGPSLINVAVLDENAWQQLATGQVIGFWDIIVDDNRIVAPMLGCADGGATNNYGRCIPYGAVFDTATRGWSDLPNAPSPGDKNIRSSGALTASQLLLTGLGSAMLDLTTDTWFRMPKIDEGRDDATAQRTIAGAGPYGFAFGGVRFGPEDPGGMLLRDSWLWTRPDSASAP